MCVLLTPILFAKQASFDATGYQKLWCWCVKIEVIMHRGRFGLFAPWFMLVANIRTAGVSRC